MFYQLCDQFIKRNRKESPELDGLDKDKLFYYFQNNKIQVGKWEKELKKQVSENPIEFINEKKLKKITTQNINIQQKKPKMSQI